jgi:prolyl oligopeptidase
MKRSVLVALLLFANACGLIPVTGPFQPGRWTYPQARQADLVEDFHGTGVPDPYHWMIDPDSPETMAWVTAQNELTRAWLDAVPERDTIRARLTQLWNYPRLKEPLRKYGNRYFYLFNNGLQEQSALMMREGLDGEPTVVLDPNTLSSDGTVSLMSREFSEDGRLMAYTLSRSGSDLREIWIRDIDTGKDYDEVLHRTRYTSLAWKHDGSGFFYNAFPESDSAAALGANIHSWVYWHSLGTPQALDTVVYRLPEESGLRLFPWGTHDGKYLVIWVYHGTSDQNGIYYRDLENGSAVQKLFDVDEALYNVFGNNGTVLYIHTDLGAPRGRIVALDVAEQDQRNWVEIVPEQQDVIDEVALVNNHLVVQFMHNAYEQIRIYDLEGHLVKELELPTMGEIEYLYGRQQDTEFFFSFMSFLYPKSVFRYDFTTDQVTPFHVPKIDVDPDDYETTQVWYPSKDGTRVSMFITHKRGLPLDGTNPTLLYGYGGYNVNMLPYFSPHRLLFMEAGGVYAMPNLRGGSEYGEEWHQAGILGNKQNVFDDFIAASEWLIDQQYTRPEKLAIIGGSNGGLLTAVCMQQRPDLFGAVVSQVPVTDMLHYHQWTAGVYWTVEYGNAELHPEHFRFLYAYSPLHNVVADQVYPPLLVTTADTDDRVVPAHAKKFVATMQEQAARTNPILLRVETKAGHGAGKPVSKLIAGYTDIYSFLFHNLGMEMD